MQKPTWLDKLIVWTNREPWLTVRIALWIIAAGWVFFLYYLFASLVLLFSLVFIPFIPQVLHLAVFAFNPISLEPWPDSTSPTSPSAPGRAWRHAGHPYTIAANVFWLIFVGWGAALLHIMLGLVQALTIIGIPTATTNVKIAWFVLWPFPFEVHDKDLPTTLAELDPVRYSPQFQSGHRAAPPV